MKDNNKLPTVIGVLMLLSGVVFGVLLTSNKQIFKLKASEVGAVEQVRVSNIQTNSVNISFIYSKKAECFIKYGNNGSSLTNTAIRKNARVGYSQYFLIDNLETSTNYFFKVLCGSEEYFNKDGDPWVFKTALKSLNNFEPYFISGVITDEVGSFVEDAIVQINIDGGKTMTSLTTKNGSFLIDISKTYNQTLTKYLESSPLTMLYIDILLSPQKRSLIQIPVNMITQVPAFIIGKNYNYKTDTNLNKDANTPESYIFLPEE